MYCHRFIFILVSLLTIQNSLFAQPDSTTPIMEYLKQFNEHYTKAMKEGNPDAILSYYADSVRLMPEFQRTVLGKENASSYYAAYLDRFEILNCERKIFESRDLGIRVLEIGSFTSSIRIKETESKQELEGNYLNIWRKDENSQLVLLTEAWNYNRHYEGFHEYLKFEEIPSITVAFQTHKPVNNSISFELEALGLLLGVTVSQHDADRWSQFYTDDAILIPNYYPLYEGREAIDGYIKKHITELPVFEDLDIRNDQIDDLGNYVIEYASHVAHWRTGEYSGVSTGKNIRIWRREPNCSLKIFRQIAMYD